jgi:hypothetical protein
VLVFADHAVGEKNRGKDSEDEQNNHNKKGDPVRKMHNSAFGTGRKNSL